MRLVVRALALCWVLLGCGGCSQSASDPASLGTCESLSPPCAAVGALDCSQNGSSVIECRSVSTACLVWVTHSSCGAHGTCTGGACVCHDECAPIDGLRCAGTAIERCRADAFGCAYWEEETRCADSGKTCEPLGSSVGCVGGCDVDGATRCEDTILQACTQNAQGYLDWAAAVNCADNGQVCRETSGTAECADP